MNKQTTCAASLEYPIPWTELFPYQPQQVMSINDTLKERGSRYGSFVMHATCTQRIKAAFEEGTNWNSLAPDQTEALEMIAHKIGRILEGDPDYADSWHDIAGYASLIDKRLTGEVL